VTIPVFLAVLTVAVVVGFAYTSIGFWAILGGLAAAAASIFLFSSARALVVTVFVAKPLIDMLWFAGVDIAGISVNASSVLSVVIVIAVLVFVAVHRVQVQRGLLAPMLAVLLMNVWALVMTPDMAYGVQYMIRVVCGFPLVFVVPVVIDQLPSAKRLLQAFFVVMAFVCLTVVLQPLGVLAYSSFDQGYGRATGFYYHPWDVARYMVILIPLLLAMVDEPGRERLLGNLPYWGLLAAGLMVTYFTFLKAAWLAVLFQMLLWLVFTGRRGLAFGCLVATIALVAFPLRAGFVSVFSDLWKLSDTATRGEALSGRVFLWGEYWGGLRNSGVGQILFGQGYMPKGWSTTGAAVHDDYLRLVVMTGVTGLLAYLALMFAAIAALGRSVALLAKRGGLEWRIGLAVQCLLGAYFLMGITADPSSYPSLTIYLWLLIGLVIGYARLAAKESQPDFVLEDPRATRLPRGRSGL
jgi:putative inorganic carbon (HCO3(-)) transporter